MANILRKISAKNVVGDIKKMVAADQIKKETVVMRVLGVAHATTTGASSFGDWMAFKGRFKATNTLTGEEFSSGKCFLPSIASEIVETALALRTDHTLPVEFAMDITVVPDSTVAVGYQYGVQQVFEAAPDDVLDRLTRDADGMKKLPKPKAVV